MQISSFDATHILIKQLGTTIISSAQKCFPLQSSGSIFVTLCSYMDQANVQATSSETLLRCVQFLRLSILVSLKMEAVYCSDILVNTYQNTRCNNSEDLDRSPNTCTSHLFLEANM